MTGKHGSVGPFDNVTLTEIFINNNLLHDLHCLLGFL